MNPNERRRLTKNNFQALSRVRWCAAELCNLEIVKIVCLKIVGDESLVRGCLIHKNIEKFLSIHKRLVEKARKDILAHFRKFTLGDKRFRLREGDLS
jgi:hypothetical protein